MSSIKAINWNNVSEFDNIIWKQNNRNIWFPEEISITDDKLSWKSMNKIEQDTYKKVLGGLTLLDTQQSLVGMPKIMLKCNDLHQKSIMMFMGMMEVVHAKSYSSIFTTLCTSEEINNIFDWTDTNIFLVEKMRIILDIYDNIDKYSIEVAMAVSVMLESFLFYSGFFYPLYLAGHGKLTSSNEIINLIVRDESIHAVYIGQLFQKENKNDKNTIINDIFNKLFEIELNYTDYLYKDLNLVSDVQNFIKYNSNKAFMNLGLDIPFPDLKDSDINPLVIKGLSTETKTHNFFDSKGNGYIKPNNIEKISDDDFNF
jgi:ribonucleoside-diphosphate reductase beta chain